MKNITYQFLKKGFRFTNKIINKFGIIKIKEINTLKIVDQTYIKKIN